MTICAKSTIDVIALTQRPASTPTPIASATSPHSLARRRARSLAMATSARRGGNFMVAASLFRERSRAWANLCAAGGAKPRAASPLRQGHVVAMDHLGAPRGSEDVDDVARLAAADALGVQGVIGDEPAPDLGAPLVPDGDAVPA